MTIRESHFRSALCLGAAFLAGCLDGGDPGPAAPAAAEVQAQAPARVAAAQDYIAFPALKPAFTSYAAVTGWALDPFTQDANGNYKVKRWNNGNWAYVPGALTDIDISGNTVLWGVDNQRRVLRNTNPYALNGGTWQTVCANSYCLADGVATGANGDVYITIPEANNRWAVMKYLPSSGAWYNMGVNLRWIDVDNNGDLYGIPAEGTVIWRLRGGTIGGNWGAYGLPEGFVAKDLAVGGGRIYLLDGNQPNGIYGWRAHSYTWGGQPSVLNIWLKHIQADAAGRLWGTNGEHSLYRIAP